MRASTRLQAPRGTTLDWSDVQYCESRKFKSKSPAQQVYDSFGWASKLTLVSQYREYGVCA